MATNSSLIDDLGGGLLSGLAYCGAGLLVLLIGVFIVDMLTPGKLTKLIYEDRNWNASILVGANVIAVGSIVTTSIVTSHDQLTKGLTDTAGYGLLGIIVLAAAFVVLDLITPGRLGRLVTDERPHPAIVVTATVTLVIGAVVSASIA